MTSRLRVADRAITTRLLAARMLQGYVPTSDKCLSCRVPLMERGGEVLCVVCPETDDGDFSLESSPSRGETRRPTRSVVTDDGVEVLPQRSLSHSLSTSFEGVDECVGKNDDCSHEQHLSPSSASLIDSSSDEMDGIEELNIFFPNKNSSGDGAGEGMSIISAPVHDCAHYFQHKLAHDEDAQSTHTEKRTPPRNNSLGRKKARLRDAIEEIQAWQREEVLRGAESSSSARQQKPVDQLSQDKGGGTSTRNSNDNVVILGTRTRGRSEERRTAPEREDGAHRPSRGQKGGARSATGLLVTADARSSEQGLWRPPDQIIRETDSILDDLNNTLEQESPTDSRRKHRSESSVTAGTANLTCPPARTPTAEEVGGGYCNNVTATDTTDKQEESDHIKERYAQDGIRPPKQIGSSRGEAEESREGLDECEHVTTFAFPKAAKDRGGPCIPCSGISTNDAQPDTKQPEAVAEAQVASSYASARPPPLPTVAEDFPRYTALPRARGGKRMTINNLSCDQGLSRDHTQEAQSTGGGLGGWLGVGPRKLHLRGEHVEEENVTMSKEQGATAPGIISQGSFFSELRHRALLTRATEEQAKMEAALSKKVISGDRPALTDDLTQNVVEKDETAVEEISPTRASGPNSHDHTDSTSVTLDDDELKQRWRAEHIRKIKKIQLQEEMSKVVYSNKSKIIEPLLPDDEKKHLALQCIREEQIAPPFDEPTPTKLTISEGQAECSIPDHDVISLRTGRSTISKLTHSTVAPPTAESPLSPLEPMDIMNSPPSRVDGSDTVEEMDWSLKEGKDSALVKTDTPSAISQESKRHHRRHHNHQHHHSNGQDQQRQQQEQQEHEGQQEHQTPTFPLASAPSSSDQSLASLSSSVRLQAERVAKLEADALLRHQEAEAAAASARDALEKMTQMRKEREGKRQRDASRDQGVNVEEATPNPEDSSCSIMGSNSDEKYKSSARDKLPSRFYLNDDEKKEEKEKIYEKKSGGPLAAAGVTCKGKKPSNEEVSLSSQAVYSAASSSQCSRRSQGRERMSVGSYRYRLPTKDSVSDSSSKGLSLRKSPNFTGDGESSREGPSTIREEDDDENESLSSHSTSSSCFNENREDRIERRREGRRSQRRSRSMPMSQQYKSNHSQRHIYIDDEDASGSSISESCGSESFSTPKARVADHRRPRRRHRRSPSPSGGSGRVRSSLLLPTLGTPDPAGAYSRSISSSPRLTGVGRQDHRMQPNRGSSSRQSHLLPYNPAQREYAEQAAASAAVSASYGRGNMGSENITSTGIDFAPLAHRREVSHKFDRRPNETMPSVTRRVEIGRAPGSLHGALPPFSPRQYSASLAARMASLELDNAGSRMHPPPRIDTSLPQLMYGRTSLTPKSLHEQERYRMSLYSRQGRNNQYPPHSRDFESLELAQNRTIHERLTHDQPTSYNAHQPAPYRSSFSQHHSSGAAFDEPFGEVGTYQHAMAMPRHNNSPARVKFSNMYGRDADKHFAARPYPMPQQHYEPTSSVLPHLDDGVGECRDDYPAMRM
ncbi:hypothetical protein ACHAWF_018467 [Thalassiosira exigua]